jgi:hypothetical protein
MKKFELRRQSLQEEYEAKLKALAEQEQKELEKTVRPVASKLSRVMEEEVKKLLEADPDRLEGFSFRKKEASEAIRGLLENMFAPSSGTQEPRSVASNATQTAHQNAR